MTNILVPYHLDEHVPDLDVPVSPEVTITGDLPSGDRWQRMSHLYGSVAAAVAADIAAGVRPLVMSSDCTTSLGIVAGMQSAGMRPSVVWFDGHGDVQTVETSTSGYLGGMPLRILAGYRPELVADSLGMRPIDESTTLLVGARDLDPPEAEYLATAPIRRCAVTDVRPDILPPAPIYLHVDFDVTDPADLPGLLFPTADGPGVATVAAAIDRVLDTRRVAAIGLGCTWHPGNGAADRVRTALAGILP